MHTHETCRRIHTNHVDAYTRTLSTGTPRLCRRIHPYHVDAYSHTLSTHIHTNLVDVADEQRGGDEEGEKEKEKSGEDAHRTAEAETRAKAGVGARLKDIRT